MILRILTILFIISIFIPVEFHYLLGSLRIETYRVVLGLALVASIINIKQVLEKADFVDILLGAFIVLATASLMYNHGPQKGLESSGILAIEDFGSSTVLGLKASFHATEDFFLQANYGQAEAGQTTAEYYFGDLDAPVIKSRDYKYYNLLVGYNLFPGETFVTQDLTFNSAFYLVAGAGNTDFADDNHFTVTIGSGYRSGRVTIWVVIVNYFDGMSVAITNYINRNDGCSIS